MTCMTIRAPTPAQVVCGSALLTQPDDGQSDVGGWLDRREAAGDAARLAGGQRDGGVADDCRYRSRGDRDGDGRDRPPAWPGAAGRGMGPRRAFAVGHGCSPFSAAADDGAAWPVPGSVVTFLSSCSPVATGATSSTFVWTVSAGPERPGPDRYSSTLTARPARKKTAVHR